MLPLPLALRRVLDLTRSSAGATAGRHLADFGAEVIAVERPGAPADVSRATMRNKFSCVIDTDRPEARDLLIKLATESDVVLVDEDDTAPPGLSYEALKTAREDIIIVAIADGAGRPALGVLAAAAVITALMHHRYAGVGSHVRVDADANAASLAALPLVAASAASAVSSPDLTVSGVYVCREGRLAVVVRSIEQLAALGEVIGRPELADALSGGEELQAPLAAWAAERSAEDAASLLLAAGVPAQPLLTAADLQDDPHLRARGLFEPVADGDAVDEVDGVRFRFGATPAHVRLPPPEPGQHNDYVLRDIAGLDAQEIAGLIASGVVAKR